MSFKMWYVISWIKALFHGTQMLYEVAILRQTFQSEAELYDGSRLREPVINSEDTITTPDLSTFDIDQEFNLPISLALFLLVFYMCIGATIYTALEDWDIFESFYFSFISLSTVGFGDFIPHNPTAVVLSVVYIFGGLSLMSMCVTVVQEQINVRFHDCSVHSSILDMSEHSDSGSSLGEDENFEKDISVLNVLDMEDREEARLGIRRTKSMKIQQSYYKYYNRSQQENPTDIPIAVSINDIRKSNRNIKITSLVAAKVGRTKFNVRRKQTPLEVNHIKENNVKKDASSEVTDVKDVNINNLNNISIAANSQSSGKLDHQEKTEQVSSNSYKTNMRNVKTDEDNKTPLYSLIDQSSSVEFKSQKERGVLLVTQEIVQSAFNKIRGKLTQINYNRRNKKPDMLYLKARKDQSTIKQENITNKEDNVIVNLTSNNIKFNSTSIPIQENENENELNMVTANTYLRFENPQKNLKENKKFPDTTEVLNKTKNFSKVRKYTTSDTSRSAPGTYKQCRSLEIVSITHKGTQNLQEKNVEKHYDMSGEVIGKKSGKPITRRNETRENTFEEEKKGLDSSTLPTCGDKKVIPLEILCYNEENQLNTEMISLKKSGQDYLEEVKQEHIKPDAIDFAAKKEHLKDATVKNIGEIKSITYINRKIESADNQIIEPSISGVKQENTCRSCELCQE